MRARNLNDGKFARKGDAVAGGIVGVTFHLRGRRGRGLRPPGQAGVGFLAARRRPQER